jgi:hypothetical protein
MKPFANTRLATFLERRVLELKPKKKQQQIAIEAGFRNPNMIAMLKSGATKLPLDRVPSLAKALECDPAFLLRLALEQVNGDTAAQALIEVFGEPITKNEHGWLQAIRDASGGTDPRITSRARVEISGVFGK